MSKYFTSLFFLALAPGIALWLLEQNEATPGDSCRSYAFLPKTSPPST